MMIMPANNSSSVVHYLAGKFPSSVGWLVGPTAMAKTKFVSWMPFALDNDAFAAWTEAREWDEGAWMSMLLTIAKSKLKPLWMLLPDVVTNPAETIAKWEYYQPYATALKWPLAFAVQDGMSKSDVPSTADVVFVGGSTEWKWNTAAMWCSSFPVVHIGRVNSVKKLDECLAMGAKSVDGTGWFRDNWKSRPDKDFASWISLNHL